MKTGVNNTEQDFDQCIEHGEETVVGSQRPSRIRRAMGEAADPRNSGRLRPEAAVTCGATHRQATSGWPKIKSTRKGEKPRHRNLPKRERIRPEAWPSCSRILWSFQKKCVWWGKGHELKSMFRLATAHQSTALCNFRMTKSKRKQGNKSETKSHRISTLLTRSQEQCIQNSTFSI